MLGLAIAMGLLPGNVFVLIGALAASVVVRSLLAGVTNFDGAWWLVPIGWSLAAGAFRFGTADLGALSGAQAALGPSVLVLPIEGGAIAGISAALGLVSGIFWVGSLPRLQGAEVLDALLGWGECALVAATALSVAGGLLIGGFAHGPIDGDVLARGAGAFGAVGVGTMLVSGLRRSAARLASGRARWVLGLLSLASLSSAVVLT